jgi:hypothetical protein
VNPLGSETSLYEICYEYHGIQAHLNGLLPKYLPSLRVPVCLSLLSLLGNGSVKRYCGNEYTGNRKFQHALFAQQDAFTQYKE